jgi:hypothetical protein
VPTARVGRIIGCRDRSMTEQCVRQAGMAHFDARVWPTCQRFWFSRSVVLFSFSSRSLLVLFSFSSRSLLVLFSFSSRSLLVPSFWGGRRGVALFPFVSNEIGDGHGFLAVGTEATRADPATEALAVRAALLAQGPYATRRTLVHRRCPWRTRWERREQGWRGLPAAPGGLPAGGRAEAAPPHRAEAAVADRTEGAAHRYAIVTRRGGGRGRVGRRRITHVTRVSRDHLAAPCVGVAPVAPGCAGSGTTRCRSR